ncbi:MAG: glycoside hydrolase family 3 N-terminal domain-containing protein, partial [Planctomycetota bacterium]
MINKRLWIGIPEPSISEETRQHLLEVRPGGVILFGRNVTSVIQLKQLIADLRSILGPSLLVSIDQEGGRVVRIAEGVTLFPGNLSLGAAAMRDRDQALSWAREQGRISGAELRELGIDVNLSPCVDLLRSSDERGIGSRSFGSDPELALALATEIGSGHRELGVHDCWKHFPGIGRVKVDPHFGLPRITKEGSEDHTVPFRGAQEAEASMIMTSHVVAEALDRENPVTTSRLAVNDFLRDELGFSGVVITDCLEMGGVSGFDFEEVVISAAVAGHDALLVSHTPALQIRALRALEKGIENDALLESEHQESLKRLGDLEANRRTDLFEASSEAITGVDLALEMARAGTTLLSGPAARVVGPHRWLLVVPGLENRSPVEDPLRGEDLAVLIEKLRPHVETMEIDSGPAEDLIEDVVERGRSRGGVLLLVQGLRHCVGTQALVAALARESFRLIIVLLEDPRDLVAIPAGEQISVITSYGFRSLHQEALASALLGETAPFDQSPL